MKPTWQKGRGLAALCALGLCLITARAAGAVSFGGEVADVTAATGKKIAGPPTSWTIGGQEHLAARDPSNHLIVFSAGGKSGWTAADLTKQLGRRVSGSPTSWNVGDVEHVAATSTSGEVLVYYRTPKSGWKLVNVTAKTGQRVRGDLTAWQSKDGKYTVEHLAGRTRKGELIGFWWSPRADWQAVNITARTGRKIAGEVTAWQSQVGRYTVEHLAGRSGSGEVLDFHWRPDGRDWQVDDLTHQTGVIVRDDLASWVVAGVEHLAGRTGDGSLLVLWRRGETRWRVVDVTSKTGATVTGQPVAYQRKEDGKTVEMLAVRSRSGSMLLFWWSPAADWQVVDLTELTDRGARSDATQWAATKTRKIGVLEVPAGFVDRVAFQGTEQRLIVVSDYDMPRRLTDAVQGPVGPFKRRQGRRPAVAILWDAHRPGHPAPAKQSIERALFGATDSVRDYVLENSGGDFTIDNVGVLGWYDADRNADHYWGPNDPDDLDGDGFTQPHHRKWAEALWKADRDFDFSAYDANGDGKVTPEELAVIIVIAQADPYGTVRSPSARQAPTRKPLVVDGVEITRILEWYSGAPEWPVAAHELGHLVLDHVDLYMGDFPNFRAGDYSIMDNSYRRTHLDPLVKLKAGWMSPKIILKDGTYPLSDVETTGRAWILMDPRRGTDEYFIVENRNRASGSYDSQIGQSGGLAVWHIIEDADAAMAMETPRGVDPKVWAERGRWTRSLRLLRPLVTPDAGTNAGSFFNSHALFDGADSRLGHDLLSRDPDPRHPELRWSDGTASGFKIVNISGAGADMEATIEVPFERSEPQAPLEPVIASTWEPFTDRPGRDYKSFNLGSPKPQLCRDACLDDARCAAWTYVKPGVQGPQARCWLKSSVPGPKLTDIGTSGVKYSVEPGIDRPGKDYRSFFLAPGDDAETCRVACLTESRCRAWTYVRPGVQGANARCWLKGSVPGARPNDATVSGLIGALD